MFPKPGRPRRSRCGVPGAARPARRLRGRAPDRGAALDRLAVGRAPVRRRTGDRAGVAVLRAVQAVEHRRLGSPVVGEALFLDTMYAGNLKAVGKVWQYGAADGARSFGFPRANVGNKSAAAMGDFLDTTSSPAYREGAIPLVEVVSGGGLEFTGRPFSRARARLGIRWHELPPRSPNLNALVERAQGSVLHLHYLTAFRYRFYLGHRHRRRPAGLAALLQPRAPPTAATAPAAVSPPQFSTRLDPTCSPQKDGLLMTSTRQPEPGSTAARAQGF